jgi:hypothetical protein
LTVDVIDGGSGYAIISINTPGTGYTNGDVVTVTNGGMSDSFTIVFSGTNSWEFDVNGAIVFPDATIQTTAFIPTTYATTGSNTFIGNQVVTGSGIFTSGLTITGSVIAPSITGSLQGTSSWSRNSISSSYPIAVSGLTIYTPFNVSGFSTDNSIFLGYSAGNLATNAYSSYFIGSYAGTNATNTNNSNFIGNEAGYQATNANNSNFIGSNVGKTATNAAYSNFLGISVGIDATNAIFSNFIGTGTGVNAASASYSTLIGYNVGSNPGNSYQSIKSNNIIIGTNITLANGRQDSINLGGLIFGTGSYSTTSGNAFSGSANGRIGINQPLPLYSLDVSGSGNYTNGLTITGSVNITETINLKPMNPLPTGTLGQLAVSSSNDLYFYNGASWVNISI